MNNKTELSQAKKEDPEKIRGHVFGKSEQNAIIKVCSCICVDDLIVKIAFQKLISLLDEA